MSLGDRRGPVRRWLGTGIFILVIAGAAFGAYRLRRVQAAVNLPSAPARQGEFLVIVRCRGELKARRSVQITAPVNVPDLRIVWLAPGGSDVKKGDTLVRFDPSSARQQLQEKESALKQAQASLDQAVAQAKVTAEQDKMDLANAHYQVEKAQLEVSKQELVSVIQGKESKIDLGLAEQNLVVAEATIRLHEASARSKTASLTRVRDQALFDINLTKTRLASMEIASPLNGIIIYNPNYSQGWQNAKPFKVGDAIWAGTALAELPDMSTLQLEARIEEIDRGRIGVGDDVRVRVDALPELTIPAKLSQLSPLTEQSMNEWPPIRRFIAYANLEHADSRLRPGMNGSMDVIINRIPGAISIPAKALFTRQGKPIVYAGKNNQYKPVEVQVLARNPDEVAVSGIPAGVMVALVDLEKTEQKR